MHQNNQTSPESEYRIALNQLLMATLIPCSILIVIVAILIDKNAIDTERLFKPEIALIFTILLTGLFITNELLTKHLNNTILLRKRMLLSHSILKSVQQHEFIPYYQAKVDTQGRIVGCEALCRWKKTNEILSPASFIDQAIETNQIQNIDISIALAGMKQALIWKKENIINTFTISFNMDPKSLSDRGVTEVIAKSIRNTIYHGVTVEVEITEQSMLTLNASTSENIHILKKAGARFALDDFSAGHSSMKSIISLQFDTLKFDRSLISPTDANQQKAKASFELIKAMNNVAKSLQINTILEGIETDKDLEFYRFTGVEQIQGFLFSKPSNEQEFTKILKQWR
ncbi:EAL domain-containing protein (plasmid) [Vibrio scophthalmi]|uniref:EAL domain-containing protein n=1 Tax=Vibrio scophthalmi TaxID=45658 RepID=UPI003EC0C3C6